MAVGGASVVPKYPSALTVVLQVVGRGSQGGRRERLKGRAWCAAATARARPSARAIGVRLACRKHIFCTGAAAAPPSPAPNVTSLLRSQAVPRPEPEVVITEPDKGIRPYLPAGYGSGFETSECVMHACGVLGWTGPVEHASCTQQRCYQIRFGAVAALQPP